MRVPKPFLAFFAVSLLGQSHRLTPLGEQKTLVYAINGIDPVAARENFFGTGVYSLTSFYQAASYGKTWFSGAVISVSISMPTTCDVPNIYQRADSAAAQQGINFDLYSRRAYLGTFPCPWGGLGPIGVAGVTAGGTEYGMVFLQGGGGYLHEMGHSLGMAHASGYPYSRAVEYADNTSVMGLNDSALPNAPHRTRLGWVEAVDVTVNGTFTLTPLSQSAGLRVLRVRKPDTNQFYYLSYRQPFGNYDNFYIMSGINIHVWNPPDVLDAFQTTTQLVDSTPGSSLGYIDAAMSDGYSFHDAVNGIQITQISHTALAAVVSVAFGATPPPPPPPPPPLTFTVGDRVFTLAKTKVAMSPGNGRGLCNQPSSARGILQAKQVASAVTWWLVNFDFGCDGWVQQSFLSK